MKILVINIKFLGDLIVSTPGLRALRKAKPQDEIVFLLRKGFVDVLADNPNIDRIITFDPGMKGNSGLQKFNQGIEFIKKIRDEKFDVVIALHPGDRIAFWSWFSGAKLSIAPRKQSFGFLFNKPVYVEEDSISYLEYYNKIFESYIGKIDSTKTEFFIPEKDETWADNFLADSNVKTDNILIGIHPGASEPTKIWQSKNFVELINRLRENENIKVLLIEGPQDKNVFEEIKDKLDNQDFILFQSTCITKTAALIRKCNLFITHDTGTRHLSVAVETPVLALLPEDNLKYWNFYNQNDLHYYLIGKRYIPDQNSGGNAFLDGITVDEVYGKACEILKLW